MKLMGSVARVRQAAARSGKLVIGASVPIGAGTFKATWAEAIATAVHRHVPQLPAARRRSSPSATSTTCPSALRCTATYSMIDNDAGAALRRRQRRLQCAGSATPTRWATSSAFATASDRSACSGLQRGRLRAAFFMTGRRATRRGKLSPVRRHELLPFLLRRAARRLCQPHRNRGLRSGPRLACRAFARQATRRRYARRRTKEGRAGGGRQFRALGQHVAPASVRRAAASNWARSAFRGGCQDLVAGASVADTSREDAPVRVLSSPSAATWPRCRCATALMFELAEALTGETPPYATLMYVWDATAPGRQRSIVNPRTDRIRKIVVDSGPTVVAPLARTPARPRLPISACAFGEDPGPLTVDRGHDRQRQHGHAAPRPGTAPSRCTCSPGTRRALGAFPFALGTQIADDPQLCRSDTSAGRHAAPPSRCSPSSSAACCRPSS